MNLKKILIFLISISLLSGGLLLKNKIDSERSANKADIILSYQDILDLSEQSDDSIETWLKKFKGIDITTIALKELTLRDLVEKEKGLTTKIVDQLNSDSYWKNYYPEEAIDYILSNECDKYDVIIETKDNEMFTFLKNRIKNIYSSDLFKVFNNKDTNIIVLNGTIKDSYYQEQNVLTDYKEKNIRREEKIASSKLLDIGLGFDENIINKIEELGLNIVLRPTNYEKYSKEKLNYFIEYVNNKNINLKYMIFIKEVLGYSENIPKLKKFLSDNKIIPVLIETPVQRSFIEQDGLEEIIKGMDYETIRLFSTMNYIQKRFAYYNYKQAEEIENAFYRAITERNIRLIYFKPFKKNEKMYVTDFQTYKNLFENLEMRIAQHNISYGDTKPFASNTPSIFMILLTTIGIISMYILFFREVFHFKEKYLIYLLVIGILGSLISFYIAPNVSLYLVAFMTFIIFSLISGYILIYYLYNEIKAKESFNSKKIIKSILILFITSLISILGGLYINSFLSHSKFILEMEFYRGVKLSLLLPVMLFSIIYMLKIGFDRSLSKIAENDFYIRDIKKILNIKIKLSHLIYFSIIAIVGLVYISRTGHESAISISSYEIMMRNYLERSLIVRPRSKEFLIAFPAVLISFYFASKRSKIITYTFAVLGMIGYTSIINTFCHLRTPIYLSIYRTIIGLLFGIVIGMIGILVFYIIDKYIRRLFYD